MKSREELLKECWAKITPKDFGTNPYYAMGFSDCYDVFISEIEEKAKTIDTATLYIKELQELSAKRLQEIAELKEKLTENYQIVSKLSTENRLQLSEIQSLKEEVERLKICDHNMERHEDYFICSKCGKSERW